MGYLCRWRGTSISIYYPIGSMYGTVYLPTCSIEIQPNVGKYTVYHICRWIVWV